MTEERTTALFFELFSGLPRQGPGDGASTERALALVPPLGSASRVLDIGCGTGAQTRVLARSTPAHITEIDSHAPFGRTRISTATSSSKCALGDRAPAAQRRRD